MKVQGSQDGQVAEGDNNGNGFAYQALFHPAISIKGSHLKELCTSDEVLLVIPQLLDGFANVS